MATNKQIREQITEQLINAMENGLLPWRCPWSTSPNAGRPANVLSRKSYTGINPLLLGLHASKHRFQSRWYGTLRQWQSLGLRVQRRPDHVAAGEWGCKIVFYKCVRRVRIKNGVETVEEFFILKTFTVFNADQVEGARRYQVVDEPASSCPPDDCETVEELIQTTGVKVVVEGSSASFRPSTETIYMPPKSTFNPPAAWHSTFLHELSHWGDQRLQTPTPDTSYAFGELVAELSSTFLCQELGVPQGESLENHAAYLQHWLGHMRKDSSYIFKASQRASMVADHLLSYLATRPEPASAA